MSRTSQREALAEAVGTYCLVFVGAGVICADAYAAGGVGLVGIALAHGLALAAIVAVFGPVSGAHVNPAVTFAALLSGDMHAARAGMYVASQLLGACVAGLTLLIVFSPDVWAPVALGGSQLGIGVEPGTGILLESILTFFLVLTVLHIRAGSTATAPAAGVAAGFALAAGVLFAAAITGGALNPARAFGPAFAAGIWESHYVYWIGPLAGAAAAGAVARFTSVAPVDRVGQAFARELEEREDAIDEAVRKMDTRAGLRVVEKSATSTDDEDDSP